MHSATKNKIPVCSGAMGAWSKEIPRISRASKGKKGKEKQIQIGLNILQVYKILIFHTILITPATQCLPNSEQNNKC